MPRDRALFINRELSWLEFNQRVLNEALDPMVPPLERLNFLGISASNLDEFFMVRVGGLESLAAEGLTGKDAAGLTPAAELHAIEARVRVMTAAQYACYNEALRPRLQAAGIRLQGIAQLSERQARHVDRVFRDTVASVISPMPAAPGAFPFIPDLALNLAVRLAPAAGGEEPRFAILPLGRSLSRFVALPAEAGHAFLLLEDVIRLFVGGYFPGVPVAECVAFRVTRNADLSVSEDDAADFLAEMQNVLRERRRSHCVRLEVEDGCSRRLLAFLREGLGVPERGVYAVPGPVNLASFKGFVPAGSSPSLLYPAWPPQPTPDLDPRQPLLDQIARRNVLLIHPYESFDPVVRFVQEAARDPGVLAIKQVLYRTSADSPIVAALREAAQRGKYVTVLVELKARFDEARNIAWAEDLQQAGAQVIYGVKGLKTHAKVCLVVRREARGVVRYTHYGTGNYNERTARVYSDVSYLSAHEDLGRDAAVFFNSLCGYSEPQRFLTVASSPAGIRERIASLVEGEIERCRSGQKGLIMAKVNSLADEKLIGELYRASQAGVEVRLNVRGICCLRPGLPGVSETITVVSVVDRFLEHSRLLYAHQGGEPRVFISSADWLTRNLDRRIELMVPIEDPAARERLIETLESYFRDTVKSSRLLFDGRWERTRPSGRRGLVRCQEWLYRQACRRQTAARRAPRATFEPHRPDGRRRIPRPRENSA